MTTLIADLAESLMASAVAALGTDAPARQSITWTDAAVPVGDCDELTVSLVRLWRANDVRGRTNTVPPIPRAQPSIPVATLRTRLTLDCWPTINAQGADPTAAAYTASTLVALEKVGTLWLAISGEANDGTLFDDVTDLGDGCLRSEVTQWSSTPPQGTMISSAFDTSVSIVHLP